MESHSIGSSVAAAIPAVAEPDLELIKQRQQQVWAAGDYGQIGVRLQIVGEALCEAVDVLATEKVLDVATGNGNAALAAARRFAHVTAIDYVPALLEQGRRRAVADGLAIIFRHADAESLPFADGTFDVALSTFGVMFAPDQARAAVELVRVVKRGGRIGLASWTPDSFIGELLRVVTSFVPPPPGLRSPLGWGDPDRLVELFGASAREIRAQREQYVFRYRSAAHFIDVFRSYYGPTHRAFAALAAPRQRELHEALLELLVRHNQADSDALVVPSAYLEAIISC